MSRNATGPAVVARAAQLEAAGAVRYVGRGIFNVAGRSAVYVVRAPFRQNAAAAWSCNCRFGQHGGRLCSHVRAADLWLRRWQAERQGAAA